MTSRKTSRTRNPFPATIRQAIIRYICARADALRPLQPKTCDHRWKLLNKAQASSKLNMDYTWWEWTYYCDRCGEHKVFTSKPNS